MARLLLGKIADSKQKPRSATTEPARCPSFVIAEVCSVPVAVPYVLYTGTVARAAALPYARSSATEPGLAQLVLVLGECRAGRRVGAQTRRLGRRRDTALMMLPLRDCEHDCG